MTKRKRHPGRHHRRALTPDHLLRVRECHNSHTVDLEALCRELGTDYRIADFRRAQPVQQMRRKVAAAIGACRADTHRRDGAFGRYSNLEGY